MAGWDHDFDVDPRDVDLLRDCFRIWRRTCARYFTEFTYYRDRVLPSGRIRFVLAYNARTTSVPPAVAEFAVEMRAVSMTQSDRRARRLPLRLLREIAIVNLPYPVADEIDDSLVPTTSRPLVITVLEDVRSAMLAHRQGVLPAAELIEALHSCITNLCLLLADGARQSDSYPQLVDQLDLGDELKSRLKELGVWRNKLKHRGQRDLAGTVLDEAQDTAWFAVQALTGVYIESVSEAVMALAEDEGAAFRLPPMFSRFGEPRVPRR